VSPSLIGLAQNEYSSGVTRNQSKGRYETFTKAANSLLFALYGSDAKPAAAALKLQTNRELECDRKRGIGSGVRASIVTNLKSRVLNDVEHEGRTLKMSKVPSFLIINNAPKGLGLSPLDVDLASRRISVFRVINASETLTTPTTFQTVCTLSTIYRQSAGEFIKD
jgi:hypothetical protein